MAIRAMVAGVHQLLSGQSTHVYWSPAISYGLSPMNAARANVTLFLFLILAVWAMVNAFRWLPLAYGAYVLAALVSVISYPVEAQPLAGLGQYLLAVIPVQMVMGRWLAVHRRWRIPVLTFSLLALIYYAGAFATWHSTGNG
jgi:hypothetical protein